MQIPIRVRDAISGNITITTETIDLQSEYAVLVAGLTIYNLGGTSPAVTGTMQTSDDGDNWANVTGDVTRNSEGVSRASWDAKNSLILRYVRFLVALSGKNPTACYSLFLNCFRSS
jgi:hypothetical protein